MAFREVNRFIFSAASCRAPVPDRRLKSVSTSQGPCAADREQASGKQYDTLFPYGETHVQSRFVGQSDTRRPGIARRCRSFPLSLFFAIGFVAMTAYFMYWGLDYTNHSQVMLFILATLFGVFMAFNISGNDVANSFGTSVGAGTLTIKQALLVAAVFEVSGAVIAGGEVTSTIRGGIVNLAGMALAPMDFVYIMMSALVAAALWLLFATKKGYPVSTTHSIIGAIVGSSIALGVMLDGAPSALALVQWGKIGEIGEIAVSWVLSPVLGGLVSYLLFSLIKRHVLVYNDEMDQQLKSLRQEKKAYKKRHKEAFERLSELQQIAYTHAMVRDADVMNDPNFHPEDLESDYYRGLHAIKQKRNEIQATRALESWVPLIAALGAMVAARPRFPTWR